MAQRVKKAKRKPGKQRGRNPPRITIPWGRGASLYRPGKFIKTFFDEHIEVTCADCFHSLSRWLENLNRERVEIGEKPLRRPNYSSFARYFHWFLILGLIERIDRKEPAIYPFLRPRQFYRLTAAGSAEVQAWTDPVRFRHPEFV